MSTVFEQIPYWGGTPQLNITQVMYDAGQGATNPQRQQILTTYPDGTWIAAEPDHTAWVPPAEPTRTPETPVVIIPPPPACTTCGVAVVPPGEQPGAAVPESSTQLLLGSAIAITFGTKYLLRRLRTL